MDASCFPVCQNCLASSRRGDGADSFSPGIVDLYHDRGRWAVTGLAAPLGYRLVQRLATTFRFNMAKRAFRSQGSISWNPDLTRAVVGQHAASCFGLVPAMILAYYRISRPVRRSYSAGIILVSLSGVFSAGLPGERPRPGLHGDCVIGGGGPVTRSHRLSWRACRPFDRMAAWISLVVDDGRERLGRFGYEAPQAGRWRPPRWRAWAW